MAGSRLNYPKSLGEFRKIFASEVSCIEYLIKSRWPEGFQCAGCGGGAYWFLAKRKKLVCRDCRKETTATSGTLMHGSHIGIQDWFWGAYLVATLTPGISALQLQRQLGLGSYEAAWFMLGRLRKGMVNDGRGLFSGVVEADETWIGGPTKNKRGRGSIQGLHKSLVVGAVEVISYFKNGKAKEKAGQVRLEIILNADGDNIKKFLQKNVAPETNVRTDGWKGYSKTALIGYHHEPQIQGAPGKAHQLAPHVHRIFSNLKTWLKGTHHGVEPKYLQNYLDEFVFRFNRRRTPMAAFQTMLGITSSKSPLSLQEFKS